MYIDPNTGGMLFQVLATFLALFSGFVLIFSGKIRATIARLRRSMRDNAVDTQDDNAEAYMPPTDSSDNPNEDN
jgi:hypothetical protein